jgi:DNA helicase II / ATP-dependent DNA helicase PcrA
LPIYLERISDLKEPESFSRSLQNPDPQWINLLKDELNSAQFEFATTDEKSLLGLAGPGSGKTRALVYRAAHLIQCGICPEELMLLTFTNKAAGEMKERLETLIGFLPNRLWAGTFHSIGARILRANAALAGRTANFTILDEDDSRIILKQLLSNQEVSDEDRKLILQRNLLGRMISQARNSDLSIREVMEKFYPYRLEYLEVVAKTAELYEQKKLETNAFDFDDLLLCWLDLFERFPQVRDHYRLRVKHLLVDEFQDTNLIQARIIDLFSGTSSICVVGDDAQSIYAFRYAQIGNILSFSEKYDDCRLVRMEKNYRSTPEIVELANCSIRHNREQLPKKLYSENPAGDKPVIVRVCDARQEAAFVLQNIWELQHSFSIPPEEIAVLYRSSYLTPEIEFALAHKGISYRTYGGVKFFQKAQIKDVLAYLKVIYNPRDENSWRRISTLQQGLGPTSFNKLWATFKDQSNPLEAALGGEFRPSRGKAGWELLINTLKQLVNMGPEQVPQLITTVMDHNYDFILKQNYPDQYAERLGGIERLAIYAERFETLAQFLESMILEESVFADSDSEFASGQMTLSTIHSAKGKEWEAIFIIGMNQGHFPSQRFDDSNLAEERRLFYVAVTRARRYLMMSTYREDYRNYGAVSEGPSVFLRELPPDCYRLVDYDSGF